MFSLPPVPSGEPVRLSATTYLAFHQCPEQALGRFRGNYPPDSKASFKGGLTHELIAQDLKTGPIENPQLAARMILAGDRFKHKIGPSGLGKPSLLYPAIEESVDMYKKFTRLPQQGFEDAEVQLEHEPSAGVTLIGKIDAVFFGPVLRDWKTGPLGEPLPQLFFYALLWAWIRGVIPRVEAVSLQTGEAQSSTPTIADLEGIAAELAILVTLVRNQPEHAERVAGPWCRYCPMLESCPEGQASRAVNN